MTEHQFTLEESRKIAVLIARAWADPNLEAQYKKSPEAVLAGAGIELNGRDAPEIPERPSAISAQGIASTASFSSASSVSTATCPCSGCSASCACAAEGFDPLLDPVIDTITKLAEDPAGREYARKLTSSWGINVQIASTKSF